jgi:eukaryotic-like serine/threonine-protein kinase
MHDIGVFHRDLKPENIMLTVNLDVLLGDFGGTKDEQSIAEGTEQTGIYTWGWADSDARAKKFNYKSEVYSFGLCIYYIIHGEPLFSRDNA